MLTKPLTLCLATCLLTGVAQLSAAAFAAPARDTPLRQSAVGARTSSSELSLRDASRNDRWLGLSPREIRWAPDGSGVFFRWNAAPSTQDVEEADPWYFVERDGRQATRLTDPEKIRRIPARDIEWSRDRGMAAWTRGSTLFVFDGEGIRPAVSLGEDLHRARFFARGKIHFEASETLYEYDVATGSLAVVARRTTPEASTSPTAADRWLQDQQQELFDYLRDKRSREDEAATVERALAAVQAIPLPAPHAIDAIGLSPDRKFLTIHVRTPAPDRRATHYMDYVHESGYATRLEARAKTGAPRDVIRLGLLDMNPADPVEYSSIRWVSLDEAGDGNTVPHGPYWSPDGSRALVQFVGEDHRDVWFTELDAEGAAARVITHDHDDAWIGGPPIQANYLEPALLEWLPDGRWVFASERSGWSHLYLVDATGTVAPLTSGAWEVRAAALSRDRTFWLLQTSRDDPADDQLYRLPATGGALERLTSGPGRHEGQLSPDGERLARLHGSATDLPDLFIDGLARETLSTGGLAAASPPLAETVQITDSGTAHYRALELAAPEIVSFPHPDGKPVWAAVYAPDTPHPDRPAVIHVHGGGYRQFAHRGWSVYGWALHVGYVNYLVQQGYTVLDFDYRGGAGFGRDYRTDIARSMGLKDADGVAAAAAWLAQERGIDADRIGMHGVSYGGFLTLMTLFRHPGVIAAGIARASVTDWAHYSDGWTSRILGVPHEDPESYRVSSPIYYAEGLEDPLLLTHGILDDNVHFQDAVRLVQRLIELEKDFDVMYYPVEPHTIATEPARYDFLRRATRFFEANLLGGRD